MLHVACCLANCIEYISYRYIKRYHSDFSVRQLLHSSLSSVTVEGMFKIKIQGYV